MCVRKKEVVSGQGRKRSWVDRDRAGSFGRGGLKGWTLGSVIEDEFFSLFLGDWGSDY